jgi:hypothetical protein
MKLEVLNYTKRVLKNFKIMSEITLKTPDFQWFKGNNAKLLY